MEKGFVQNRAWAQQLYWRTGELVGADPLNNALLALYGALHGGFGIKRTLAGETVVNAPAPELEGSTWTSAYLGADRCLAVRGGKTVPC